MKILIVGGNGYLGQAIYDTLKNTSVEVGVATLTKKKYLYMNNIQFIFLPINNKNKIINTIKDYTVIIYCAGIGAEDCVRDPLFAIEYNAIYFGKILDACEDIGNKKIIYLSSINIDKPDNTELLEINHKYSIHPYSTSHLSAENLLYWSKYNKKIDGFVIRLGNIYGPSFIKKNNIVPKLGSEKLFINEIIRTGILDNKIVLKSREDYKKYFITIDDFKRFIEKIYLLDFNIKFNKIDFIDDTPIKLSEMASSVSIILEKQIGKKITVIKNFQKNNDACFTKENKDLKAIGFNFKNNHEEVIARTISYIKSLVIE